MSFLQKRDRSAAGGDTGVSLGCGLAKRWPALAEFLSAERWPDGAPRAPGTLLICTGDGRWRGWLNDRDAEESAWLSEGTLEGLLDAVEGALRGGKVQWRKPQGNQRRRR